MPPIGVRRLICEWGSLVPLVSFHWSRSWVGHRRIEGSRDRARYVFRGTVFQHLRTHPGSNSSVLQARGWQVLQRSIITIPYYLYHMAWKWERSSTVVYTAWKAHPLTTLTNSPLILICSTVHVHMRAIPVVSFRVPRLFTCLSRYTVST